MVVEVDLKKYFPNHILETKGDNLDFLYDSILKKLEDAKKELEYIQLSRYNVEGCLSKFDNDSLTFSECEETEKFGALLNFASLQIRELENAVFYLQQLKENKINKKTGTEAVVG